MWQPRAVVWLNEAQHYLSLPEAGERLAAALQTLLTDSDRGPVPVLGTLRPEYADTYTSVPRPGEPDPYSRVRELLAGLTVTVPDTFYREAHDAATTLAEGGDRFFEDTLTPAHAHGRVTQDLVGAPELLRRYEPAPPAKALPEAAMDARRLGVGLHLPQAFLIEAATDYLTAHDHGQLTRDWQDEATAAFVDLARPVPGKRAALRPVHARPTRRPPGTRAPVTTLVPAPGPVLRMADYLERRGRFTRHRLWPPASFWHAAYTYLTDPDDLSALAHAASVRHRLQWAHHLLLRAADAGDPDSLLHLAQQRNDAGDHEGTEAFLRQAAFASHPRALFHLLDLAGTRKENRRSGGCRSPLPPGIGRAPKPSTAGPPVDAGPGRRERSRPGSQSPSSTSGCDRYNEPRFSGPACDPPIQKVSAFRLPPSDRRIALTRRICA